MVYNPRRLVVYGVLWFCNKLHAPHQFEHCHRIDGTCKTPESGSPEQRMSCTNNKYQHIEKWHADDCNFQARKMDGFRNVFNFYNCSQACIARLPIIRSILTGTSTSSPWFSVRTFGYTGWPSFQVEYWPKSTAPKSYLVYRISQVVCFALSCRLHRTGDPIIWYSCEFCRVLWLWVHFIALLYQKHSGTQKRL